MPPIEVPGELDSLSLIADFVKSAADAAGLEKREAYRLRLAVDEIATNIVVYGYERGGMTGTIRVSADIDDTRLVLCLEDSSGEYDPMSAPQPDLSIPLEERPIGGLGVFLTVQGVDDFRYERVGDVNRNLFTVHRPVPARTEG